MYDAIHENDLVDATGDGNKAQVGLVPNLAPAHPRNPERELDVTGAANAHRLYNEYMLDPLILGEFDRDYDGNVDEMRDDLKGRMDFVGINYYTKLTISGLAGPLTEDIPLLNFLPDTSDLFAWYPRGIYEVAMFVTERYGLPIYITENGTVSEGDETRPIPFLVDHLSWLRRAIAEGADIRGYFFWSLIDNYEWNHGFDMPFGLFGYDPVTKTRSLKKLGEVYGEIAADNGIPLATLETYGTAAGAQAE
jgi:beta-galactosidase